jgi:diacylglycerol O-acyltransferase
MRQLSSLDTQFLNIESATTAGHVGSVVVVEPAETGAWNLDTVWKLVAGRLHLAPVLRQRLVESPLGMSRPYWADDPSFDLGYHLRELALPAPGSDEQLGDLIARLHEHALDRARPPWEMYVVTGLAGGRAAVYTKIHHAAVDGVTGAALLGMLLDRRPEPRVVEPPFEPFAPDPLPSRLHLLGRGVTSMLADRVQAARTVPPALRHLGTATGGLKAPRTPLNGAITAQRRFAFGSVSLSDIKSVRQQYGGTVNDIVMALCTSVLRRWLIQHDGLPDVPLVAAVPVSVRHRDRKGALGNEISLMLAELPTHVDGPGDRVFATRESVEQAKDRFNAVPPTLVRDLAAVLPTNGVAARPLFGLAAVAPAPFNLFVSNVPGPRVPLWLAGARVESVYPVSAVTSFTGALNITVFTHADAVDFGFIACRDRVPDVWELVRYLRDAVDELVGCRPSPGPPKGEYGEDRPATPELPA